MGLREYCSKRVSSCVPPNGSVLDYGCGAGEIVQDLLAKGVDAYGCDVFYEGGDYSGGVPSSLVGMRILRMENDHIPFPDAHFDVVLSNQVLEHVPDLDIVISETYRVLKPGGTVISFFPSREVWYEGHCGVPLLHRFPKGDFGIRLIYAYLMRVLGFGYFKEGKDRLVWARDFCDWLDKWTYYRPYRDIVRAFSRNFVGLEHFEDDCFDWRLPRFSFIPRLVKTFIVRRGASLAFSCRKP